MFYEAFLRYGYDNNALGIVFTPRHITRFCVDLLGVAPNDRVIDVASGTGGFLVAAFDRMMAGAKSNESIKKIKSSITAFDTNPTVWALAALNMFFRGDGKSHINLGSCFDVKNKKAVAQKFTRAFLNPPFSQEEEPEINFIDCSMDALEPDGMLAAVVYAGVFADEDHAGWRREFLRKHTLMGMISLPEDLFYPTAAPTSIIIARAHIPQDQASNVFMARIWNDGYQKLKNRRVETKGSQLQEIKSQFSTFLRGEKLSSNLVSLIRGKDIKEGQEWSPQQWLPQPSASQIAMDAEQDSVTRSIYQAVAQVPELADQALDDFTTEWSANPTLPLGATAPISHFFHINNGASSGEKNYQDGEFPYVSSGDTSNSIIRIVSPSEEAEVFQTGAITVTAFGNACVQPWPFLARGNGGSAVRVLTPKYDMSFRELVWFAAQINIQRWRFFYARMAIKSRLQRLDVKSPNSRLIDKGEKPAKRIKDFRAALDRFSSIH